MKIFKHTECKNPFFYDLQKEKKHDQHIYERTDDFKYFKKEHENNFKSFKEI
jgi:hypothetical protein